MKNSIRSIRSKLTFGVISLAVLASLLTALFTFFYSFKSAYRLQDDILQQTAYFINEESQQPDLALNNHDNRIFIQNQHTDPQLDYFITDLEQYDQGFHTINKDRKKYRFYIKQLENQKIAVIFDESEFRDEIVRHSILLSTIPVLLFILLIVPLVIWIVWRSMLPINRLSRSVQQRSENNLTALESKQVPQEMQGFVSAINQLLSKVDGSMRQQKRFIADASHELRSPMTALSLQAERLIRQQQLQGNAREQANALNQGIQRIRHLLEQLLSLARVQIDESQRQQSAVSLLGIYRRVLEDLLPLADDKAIDIGLVSDTDQMIFANESEIYTLIKTICENAIIYVPHGGQIDLSVRCDEHWVMLEIDDNGSGIPVEERQQVFAPFYRILGNGQQGTGLGLAIAETIVKRYQGTIELNDSKRFEHGLNVLIRLPNGLLTEGC